MAYADKCFNFDWGNREIKLLDFDVYDSISVRWRWASDTKESNYDVKEVSIELWGKEKEDGTREEDREIVLSRDNALLLASKLTRAVHELDTEDALAELYEDVDILKDIHSRFEGDNSFEVEEQRRIDHNLRVYRRPKGGIEDILGNYLNTPKGKDTLKKMQNS